MATALQSVRASDANGTGLQRFALRHYTVAEIAAPWNLSDDAVSDFYAESKSLADLAAKIQQERAAKELTGGGDGYNN